MKINFSENKNAIIGGVLAFSLIWLGVFLSAKNHEKEYIPERYTNDKKTRYQMVNYLLKRDLIGSEDFCRNYPGDNTFVQSAKRCTISLLGKPNKVVGNKFSYELLSDEIILWRKYLIIEFDFDKDEVTSAKIVHFDI